MNQEQLLKMLGTAATVSIIFPMVDMLFKDIELSSFGLLAYILSSFAGAALGGAYGKIFSRIFAINSFLVALVSMIALLVFILLTGLDEFWFVEDLCLVLSFYMCSEGVAQIENKQLSDKNL